MSAAVEAVPIVIAGAGPVGLTAALALAQSGHRVVVLEKKCQLDPHSRATLLVPRSLEVFEALGVLPAVMAEGQRNDAIRILRAPDRRPLLTFAFDDLGDITSTPYAIALPQDRTEKILLDAAVDAGVEVAFDTPFQRFEELGSAVQVYAGGGRVFQTSFLVGEDGAHSAVREQLGWELEGKTYPTRAYLADVRIAHEADFQGGWLADPKAPSFTIAVRFGDGVWRLIESAIGGEVDKSDFEPRARRLTEKLFGAGTWRETLWTAAYRKHGRRASRFRKGRIILAGDAAHLNSPAGGQGLNAGLSDAELLARMIGEAFRQPTRLDHSLDEYESNRISAFDLHVRALTDGIERMETAPAWLRNLLFSMLGVARAVGVERLVARKLSMLDIH